MNIVRNILTAIWCAIIAGLYGFVALSTHRMSGGTTDIAVILLATPAVFALLALVYVPALILSVVAQLALLGILFFAPAAIDPAVTEMYTIIVVVVSFVSAGFVYWDIAHRRSQKRVPESLVEEF